MQERWTIISGAAFSSFLYFIFIAIIYNMTTQLRINNIIIIMLLPFASPQHITLWRMAKAELFGYSLVMQFQIAKLK